MKKKSWQIVGDYFHGADVWEGKNGLMFNFWADLRWFNCFGFVEDDWYISIQGKIIGDE